MAVQEFCNHLRILSEQLKIVCNDDSYRVGRIWQNVRLDFPCIHNRTSRSFSDGGNYPASYPENRGANVSDTRESEFLTRIQNRLPALQDIANRALNGSGPAVLLATANYFNEIENLWGNDGALTIEDACNTNNCAPATSIPRPLLRYVDLKSFIAYTLLPNFDATRWGPDEITNFLDQLQREKAHPGPAWTELASIWKTIRNRVRGGTLEFFLRSRHGRGDVRFIGDGNMPLHLTSGHPAGSPLRVRHVIQSLALPGWETEKEREKKLGMVVLTIPHGGFPTYRPTILDTMGLFSYFFLPGSNSSSSGTTWKLADDLCRNSETDYGGVSEWTAVVKNPGIPCVIKDSSGSKPAFDLVGIEFGLDHATLFEL